MSKTHWIKLYVEMLDDPKIGLLTDDLKWRFVSVLLLAGELNEDGFLPETDEMAWTLRVAPETLAGQLRTLAGRGLVELRLHPDGGERWFVSKFSERQSPSSNAERQRQWRQRNANSNAPVTKRYANVTPEYRIQNTESESESEGESGASAPARPAPPEYQPVPEDVQRAKRRRGIQDGPDEPAMLANAPPALRLLEQLTGYWPGADLAPALESRLGDAPDEVALARAVEMWRLSSHKMTNWLGIIDWYDELRRDPDWTPQRRFSRGEAPSKRPTVEMQEISPGLY